MPRSWWCYKSLFHTRILPKDVRRCGRSGFFNDLVLSWPWWKLSHLIATHTFSDLCTLWPWFNSIFIGLISARPWEIFTNIIFPAHSKWKLRRCLKQFFRLILTWTGNALIVKKRLPFGFMERRKHSAMRDLDLILKH